MSEISTEDWEIIEWQIHQIKGVGKLLCSLQYDDICELTQDFFTDLGILLTNSTQRIDKIIIGSG